MICARERRGPDAAPAGGGARTPLQRGEGRAGERRFVLGEIDSEVVHRDPRRAGILTGSSPEYSPDPCHEHLGAEGLGHVVVRAGLQPAMMSVSWLRAVSMTTGMARVSKTSSAGGRGRGRSYPATGCPAPRGQGGLPPRRQVQPPPWEPPRFRTLPGQVLGDELRDVSLVLDDENGVPCHSALRTAQRFSST